MDKQILKIVFPLFLFIISTSCKTNKTPLNFRYSRSEATQIVLNEIISSDTTEKGVYVLPEIVTMYDTIYSVSDTGYVVNFDSWFFFIDDMITADFGHPCRFVFVNSENGNDIIYPAMLPLRYLWEGKMEVVKEWWP